MRLWRYGVGSVAIVVASMFIASCGLSPKTTLVAADLPVGFGTSFQAYQNRGGDTARTVSFDLKGPWDFTKSGDDMVVRSRIIKVSQAPAHEHFTSATYAEEVLPTVQTGGDASYNFVAMSTSALTAYGQSSGVADGGPRYKQYTKPERLLVFPLTVGSNWQDTVVADNSPGQSYSIARRVVAQGQVKTPAGVFFDCFMVRVTREPTGAGGREARTIMYVWWAPNIGPVAAVGSQPGEKKLVFTDAAYVFRLKSYKVVD